MRGVKRCQGSTGRMKKHRYSNEFEVTAVKMANAPDFETKAVAEALSIHYFGIEQKAVGWPRDSGTPRSRGWGNQGIPMLGIVSVRQRVLAKRLHRKRTVGVLRWAESPKR